MNLDGLYHKVFGFLPGSAELAVGTWRLNFSSHAQRAARDDRYGAIALPGQVTVTLGDVIETEVRHGKTVKAVVRVAHTERCDLVLVLSLEDSTHDRRVLVKTVWQNERNDRHSTLRRSLYRHPKKGTQTHQVAQIQTR